MEGGIGICILGGDGSVGWVREGEVVLYVSSSFLLVLGIFAVMLMCATWCEGRGGCWLLGELDDYR
jgi:hypothetical protein